ncbi:MAG TPA: NUDIX domain-containing protein [archaeon]|nr:NUDIX domain-containing protein [archaeon]
MTTGLLDNPTQKLIRVDSSGAETGSVIDRKSAHTTPGLKHLAIQVLVFNSKKELVLHERPLKKVGGGVLDAPTTHVLSGETKEQAALRCLKNEYGIPSAEVKILSGYSYEKDYGDGSCENEYCIAAFASYSGKIIPDKEHAHKIVNVSAKKVLQELESGSSKYPVWFKETIELVKKNSEGKKFFK